MGKDLPNLSSRNDGLGQGSPPIPAMILPSFSSKFMYSESLEQLKAQDKARQMR